MLTPLNLFSKNVISNPYNNRYLAYIVRIESEIKVTIRPKIIEVEVALTTGNLIRVESNGIRILYPFF